jgi:hypothetical protein
MRENIPPRRYANHIALDSSICESYSYHEEVRYDTLMQECDVLVIVPL